MRLLWCVIAAALALPGTASARWYNPTTGQWLSLDPVGSAGRLRTPNALGPWAYANLNPLSFTDEDGRQVFDAEKEEWRRKAQASAAPTQPTVATEDISRRNAMSGERAPRPLGGLPNDQVLTQGVAIGLAGTACYASGACAAAAQLADKAAKLEPVVKPAVVLYSALWLATSKGHDPSGNVISPLQDPGQVLINGTAGSATACARDFWSGDALTTSCAETGLNLALLGRAAWTASSSSSVVRVFRVEGSTNSRIIIGSNGEVVIQGDATLFLNFGSRARAEEFLAKRIAQDMPGASMKSFEVPQSFLDDLRASAVDERFSRRFPDRPIKVDVTKAPDQFGLRPAQQDALRGAIVPGSGKIEQ